MPTYISRGRVIKELGLRRSDLVISTKIFWGPRKGPNDGGLSRKQYVAIAPIPKFPSVLNRRLFSIIEGTQESLARLGLDYVDIIFAHRHDHSGMSHTITNHMLFFNTMLFAHSPDGGNRTSLQLCHRKGLGETSLLTMNNRRLLKPFIYCNAGVLLGNLGVECS